MNKHRVRVALADDHRIVLSTLRNYLEQSAELCVVGIAASGEELLASVQDWAPNIVIIDVIMPGGINGIETTRRLRLQAPEILIIALTAMTGEAFVMGALGAGVSGYVCKDSEPEVLLAAVRSVARGGTYIDPSVASALVRGRISSVDVTPREKEVLLLMGRGYGNKEIADKLGISDETVKAHVTSLLRKLEAENRLQAIVQALKRGLISIEELD